MNNEPLLEMLDHISSGSDGSSCLEISSKAGGIYRSLHTFDYLFGIMLSERFFGVTDSLRSSLQGKSVTAFDTKKASETVSKKLLSLKTDTEFGLTLLPDLKSYSCLSQLYLVFVDLPDGLILVQTLISSPLLKSTTREPILS